VELGRPGFSFVGRTFDDLTHSVRTVGRVGHAKSKRLAILTFSIAQETNGCSFPLTGPILYVPLTVDVVLHPLSRRCGPSAQALAVIEAVVLGEIFVDRAAVQDRGDATG